MGTRSKGGWSLGEIQTFLSEGREEVADTVDASHGKHAIVCGPGIDAELGSLIRRYAFKIGVSVDVILADERKGLLEGCDGEWEVGPAAWIAAGGAAQSPLFLPEEEASQYESIISVNRFDDRFHWLWYDGEDSEDLRWRPI